MYGSEISKKNNMSIFNSKQPVGNNGNINLRNDNNSTKMQYSVEESW